MSLLSTLFLALTISLVALKLAERIVNRHFWMPELSKFGVSRQTKLPGTVVVCGGSISGILAARVCSDHFEQVVVVDPEFSSSLNGKMKKRILQYNSLHGYMLLFLYGLRRLWPDLDQELVDAGAWKASADVQVHYGGVHIPAPFNVYSEGSFPTAINIRRRKLEAVLQKLLLRAGNIKIIDNTVRNIVPSEDRKNIQSVVLRDEGSVLNDVALVIDCTGASQSGLKWLKTAGYAVPDNSRLTYDHKVHYVTVTFHPASDVLSKLPIPEANRSSVWMFTYQVDGLYGNSGFVFGRVDDGTVQLCCGAWGISELPMHPEEIEDFVRNVRGPKPVPEWVIASINTLAEQGSPEFEPVKIPRCSYVHYDEIKELPSNFIALGDSVMQINPIYAQGCSKALIGAITLNSLLSSSNKSISTDFSSKYFYRTRSQMTELWDGAKAIDYGFSTTEPVAGETLASGKWVRWYSDKLVAAATKNESVASALFHVRHLLRPSTDLFAPRILFTLVLHNLSRLWR